MNFQDLHELLRLEVIGRIERGTLTGTRLAQQTGFRQGHISNFLNRKRGLSLEGLDRVLAAQELSVEEILPVTVAAAAELPVATEAISPAASGAAAGASEPAEFDPVEMVPVVPVSAAAEERQIQAGSVLETLPVARSRLLENHARPSRAVAGWQRFVAIRVDGQQAAAMRPVVAAGCVAVIDRHYHSLAAYHAERPTLYAVRSGPGLLLRYVELEDGRLILRPLAADCPVQLIAIGAEEMPSRHIVGRVCMVSQEV